MSGGKKMMEKGEKSGDVRGWKQEKRRAYNSKEGEEEAEETKRGRKAHLEAMSKASRKENGRKKGGKR